MKNKRVAIIGTNGIPARYGGYETLVEYLTKHLSHKTDFIVYCSNVYKKADRKKYYNGARLRYLPLRANGIQSVFYDIISTIHAWFTCDVLLILGPAAGFILPLNILFRKKIIINHGGLDEWKREKYSNFQKKILKLNRVVAAKHTNVHIADNLRLKESLKDTFKIDAEVIAYGGDHIHKSDKTDLLKEKYPFLNNEYALSVSRAQVDNNLHVLLEAFKDLSSKNLVLVSNWQISDYGKNLKKQYSGVPNLFLVDAVYDKHELDVIRSNTSLYVHSHSRCGTSPSLVEAMSYEIPIICYDVQVNRDTTKNQSCYFNDSESIKQLIEELTKDKLETIKESMYTIAKENYTWDKVANDYYDIFVAI